MDTNIATRIIDKFGGQKALAELLQKGPSTVQYWASKGVIPVKWHKPLLELAAKQGVELQPADFVGEITVEVVEKIEKATHWGELKIGDANVPCYVLQNAVRVISLKGAVVSLIGTSGGQLAEYLKVKVLQAHLPPEFIPNAAGELAALFKFDTGAEGIGKFAMGMDVEKFMDLCGAYSDALQDHLTGEPEKQLTPRQMEICIRASMFLRAAAKLGIVALVDEATGYQYERPLDALQLKMKLFLETEMRKWEKTYPDQLWIEFGRLTNWKGTLHQRPKYWGKLVIELVYGYLDADVAKWLKENAPKPVSGKNYHQWLTSQYGLKKLIEHIWMLIGMAAACNNMGELRRKMAERFGRVPVQMTLFLPPEKENSK